MRVIAGIHRSRPLISPKGIATRPTSDRLRETLFNILAPRIAQSRFADLYAGSGAVGIEALSRNATHVYFSEAAQAATSAIRENLKSLKITQNFSIEPAGTATLLKRLIAEATPLDIIFLDPPYESADEYARTLATLGNNATALLHADSIVIAEHAKRTPLAEQYGQLTRTRVKEQGDAALSFYSSRTAAMEAHRGVALNASEKQISATRMKLLFAIAEEHRLQNLDRTLSSITDAELEFSLSILQQRKKQLNAELEELEESSSGKNYGL